MSVETILSIAQALSKAGFNGCKEDGDVENCLTIGCPCCKQAERIVDQPPQRTLTEDGEAR